MQARPEIEKKLGHSRDNAHINGDFEQFADKSGKAAIALGTFES